MLSDDDRRRLESLEESLWRSPTRFDPVYFGSVLAAEFFEFGRSGRVHDRGASMDMVEAEINAQLPLPRFTLVEVSDDVVLATYDSEITHERREYAHRSSLWRRNATSWELVFHQATPFAPDEATPFAPDEATPLPPD